MEAESTPDAGQPFELAATHLLDGVVFWGLLALQFPSSGIDTPGTGGGVGSIGGFRGVFA